MLGISSIFLGLSHIGHSMARIIILRHSNLRRISVLIRLNVRNTVQQLLDTDLFLSRTVAQAHKKCTAL